MNQSIRVLPVEGKKVIIQDQSDDFNSENYLDFRSDLTLDLHGCGIAIPSYTVLRQHRLEPACGDRILSVLLVYATFAGLWIPLSNKPMAGLFTIAPSFPGAPSTLTSKSIA